MAETAHTHTPTLLLTPPSAHFRRWQIYGGIGMAVASLTLLTILALSNRSYMLSRFTLFLWPLILLLSAIRAGVMLFQLNRQQSKITWECANGRQLWPESAKQDWAKEDSTMPGVLCILNFHSLYILFAFGLVIDLVMQMYATFMIWRFKSAIEHAYRQVRDDKGPGYY